MPKRMSRTNKVPSNQTMVQSEYRPIRNEAAGYAIYQRSNEHFKNK